MTEQGTTVIEAVVFDLGGVFTDSPFEALRAAGVAKGASAEDALSIVFGSYDEDTDHPWHRAERGELELEVARAAIRDLGLQRGIEIDLFDMLSYMSSDGGLRHVVVERVRVLRGRGIRTALLTNNVAEFRDYWRKMLPVDELFDVVVDSSEVGIRKPNPAVFALTLEMLGGVAPERAAFLDDYPGNVAAARRLGMHGIVVEPDPTVALAHLDALMPPPPH